MFTSFGELKDRLDSVAGREVSLSGHLLVGEGRRAFLSTNYEEYERGIRLPILDSGSIAKCLLENLAPYGGSNATYSEDAFLIGTVVQVNGTFVLDRLRYCRIVREEIEIIVPLKFE